jgi:uncharacterized membrane protein YbhN (UPF0104 family)
MRWTSITAAAAAAGGLVASVAALTPIEVVGNKFFNADGSQFFMKGMHYSATVLNATSFTD